MLLEHKLYMFFLQDEYSNTCPVFKELLHLKSILYELDMTRRGHNVVSEVLGTFSVFRLLGLGYISVYT
jgi:hypothetical protein